jgi:O-antigen/teichoic acid export membrane protein
MMFTKRRTVWFDVIIYGVGLAISRLVGFVMIPVYTRALTPADYGVIETLARLADATALLAGAGISSAVLKFYTQAQDEAEANKVISTACGGIAIMCAIAFAIMAPVLPMAYQALNLPRSAHVPGYLLLGATLVDVIALVPLAYLRVRRRAVTYVVYSLARLLLALSLNIALIVWMRLGVWGVAMSGIISSSLSAFTLTALVLRETIGVCSWRLFGDMLRYGLPLVPANVAMFVLHNSDRFFLARYSSMAETGIYGLSYRFGTVLSTLVVQPFVLMWSAQQFSLATSRSYQESLARIGRVFWDVLVVSWLVLSVGSYLALRVMTPSEYWGAARFIPLVLLAYVLFGINHVFQTVLYVRSATPRIAWANIVSALLCLVLNWGLIPPYGAMGAAIATLLSFGTVAALTLFQSQREIRVHYAWGQLAASLFVAIASYLSFVQLYRQSPLPALLISVIATSFLGYRTYRQVLDISSLTEQAHISDEEVGDV